jgi:hypothetical protein
MFRLAFEEAIQLAHTLLCMGYDNRVGKKGDEE